MRRALFIVILLLLIGGMFAGYVAMQPDTPRGVTKQDAGPRDPMNLTRDREKSVGDVGAGSKPWMKVYDEQARLSYQFRADTYAPERAGRVAVEGPHAEFFQYVRDEDDTTGKAIRTQRIQLVGKTGEVEVQQGPKASADKGFEKGSGGPPKRGLLNDVTIKVFHRFSDVEKGVEPEMTITAPNVSFDNESFEIATRGYRNEQGVDVPADQVPVRIDGDYEFRGRGLNMRWNDVDGRLDYLEIAHGDYLIIKDPDGLSKREKKPEAAPPASLQRPGTSSAQPSDLWHPSALASLDDRQVGAALPSAGEDARAPKTRPAAKKSAPSQPPYRATFERDVRVSEGQFNVSETLLAVADLMHLDFRSGSSGDGPATKPSTKPATIPATSPAASSLVAEATQAPATAPTDRGSKGPKTQPTTKPAQPPIIVRWNGKLRIKPLDGPGELPMPLAAGQSVLRLVGTTSPVRLTRDFNQIDCTAADYFSNDRSVMMRGSPAHGPVVLRQLPDPKLPAGASRQATIVTQAMNYDGTKQVATLSGKSNAIITLPQEGASATRPATQPIRPQIMTASWTRQGLLYFKDGRGGDGIGGDMSFDRADFAGDVDVNHPQLALKSQTLSMQFEDARKTSSTTRPSSQMNLKQVVATTDVWADLFDAQGQKQSVTTDQLTVDTTTDAAGRMYPRIVTAVGNTHAFDEKQSLRAGGVELTLAPVPDRAARPASLQRPGSPSAPEGADSRPRAPTTQRSSDTVAVELQTMRAWDGVLVSSADGATVSGEMMTVKVVDGQMVASVAGRTALPDARPAVVTDAKGNTVTGPVIEFDPKRQWAKVAGAGSIRAFQTEEKPAGEGPKAQAGGPSEKADVQAGSPHHKADMQAGSPHHNKPRKFVDIVWETDAELDGLKDRIVVAGPVKITSTDDDGTLNTASGKRAVIELASRPPTPTTRPMASATKPAKPATRPSVVPGLAGNGGMDFLQDKVVTAVNLETDAIASSTLADETGILRQFELKSDRFRYEAAPDSPATFAATRPAGVPLAMNEGGRLIVPGPGTMIYRDHRPVTKASTRPAGLSAASQPAGEAVVASNRPATRPAPSAEPGVASDAPGQARGATAFQWKQSLVYDQRTREAEMLGDVVIVHQPDGNELPVRVTGDRALAIFEEKSIPRVKSATPKTQPAAVGSADTKPATVIAPDAKVAKANKADPTTMQLKRLMIAGNMVVFRGGSELTADRMVYDPATGWMTAHGADRQPATFGDAGQPNVWAEEIHWNAQSWLTKFVGVRVRTGSDGKGLGGK